MRCDRDDLVDKLLATLADDDPAKPVVEALFNGGKVWEIPQSMYEGARKPRKWEVTEPNSCPTCGGSGEVPMSAALPGYKGVPYEVCPACHGSGIEGRER